jgi:hypothetical protein
MDIATARATVAAGPQWIDRADRETIPPHRWGVDHGGALAEVLYAVRQRKGHMDWTRIMLSQRNWPMLFAAKGKRAPADPADAADKFGLRLGLLSDGVRQLGYCQGDALMDFVMHDLVVITMPPLSEDGAHYLKPNGYPLREGHPVPADLPTGRVEWELMPWATFSLTELGWKVAHEVDRRAGTMAWNTFFTEVLASR